jgi:hypothetical protein
LDGNDGFATQQYEAERTLLFALFVCFPFHAQAAKLFTIAEHHVHVLVEGHKLADQHTAVVDRNAHAVVDVLHDFAVLGHATAHGSHLDGGRGRLSRPKK